MTAYQTFNSSSSFCPSQKLMTFKNMQTFLILKSRNKSSSLIVQSIFINKNFKIGRPYFLYLIFDILLFINHHSFIKKLIKWNFLKHKFHFKFLMKNTLNNNLEILFSFAKLKSAISKKSYQVIIREFFKIIKYLNYKYNYYVE